MKIQKIMLVVLFSIASLVLLCSIDLKMKNIYKFSQKINFGHENEISKPPSLLMYENLEKYSKEYNIPKYIISQNRDANIDTNIDTRQMQMGGLFCVCG